MGTKKHLTRKRGNAHRNGKAKEGSFERGAASEKHFQNALKERFDKPSWYYGWRRATPFEDHCLSTDFVIFTAHGEVCVDIKSSETGRSYKASKLRKIQPAHHIILIVVKPDMPLSEIRKVLFEKIEKYFDHIYVSVPSAPS